MATTRPRPDNNATTKPEETKTPPVAPPVAPPIPCVGPGPLGGHPIPSGATHFRIHSCDGTGKLGVALVLGHDDEGGPITRAPVALMGDPRWWDVWPANGGFVRLVFARVHGDQVLARMGSGPLWVPKNRREGTAAPSSSSSTEPAPSNPVMTSPDGSLFQVLLQLQSMADSRAKLEIAAVREQSHQQRQADRDFMRSMSELMVGARREERRDAERSTRRAALDIADAARAAVAEAHELEREDRADDEPEEQKIAEQADLIGRALSGLGDSVKPILSELARRAANGNLPGASS